MTTDTEDLMATTAIGLGAIAVAFGLGASYAIYVGAILWVMWGWFVVPLGVVHISVAWAIGLVLLLGLLLRPLSVKGTGKMPEWTDVLLRPLFILGTGFVAKQFM